MSKRKRRPFVAGSHAPSLGERLAVVAGINADPVIGPLLAEASEAVAASTAREARR